MNLHLITLFIVC